MADKPFALTTNIIMRRARRRKKPASPDNAQVGEFPKRKVWILAILAAVVSIALAIWAYSLDYTSQSESDWVLFLGSFHILVVHLPIGVLLVLWVLEVLGLFRPLRYLRANAMFLLSVTAITACVAVIYGCLLAAGEGMEGEMLMSHLRSGLFLAAFVLIALPLRVAAPAVAGHGGWLAYHGVLFLAVVTMAVTSHLGGSLVHGESHLVRNMPTGMKNSLERVLPGSLQEFIGLRERGAADGTGDIPADINEASFFHAVLLPTLEASCIDCHGPDRDRGRYRMHELAQFMEGGNEGSAVVLGEPGKSQLLTRVTLPEEDEDFMPPRDRRPVKDPLSEEAIAMLRWWIESAIPPETPMGEMDFAAAPAEVVEVVELAKANYGKPREPVVASADDDLEFGGAAGPAEVVPQDALDELNATISGRLLPISRRPEDGLELITAGVGESFTDETLRQLLPVAPSLRWLDLSHTAVTDEGMATVAEFTGLTRLRLDGTRVTSAGVQLLAPLESLEYLNLFNTDLDDDAVPVLSSMHSLQSLYLFESGVSEEGAAAIREALPEAVVNTGIEEPEEFEEPEEPADEE